MGYSKEVYTAVRSRLSQRRQSVHNIAENRRRQLYSDIPELEVLDREQLEAGATAAKAMLMPGADTEAILNELNNRNVEIDAARKEIFLECGIPTDYLEIPFYCPSCRDTGYVDGVMCECMKKELKAEAYKRLNALSPLTLSGFEQFKLEYYSDQPDASKVVPRVKMLEIYNYCVKYANTFSLQSPSILMLGSAGLGKTHLSLSIAAKAIDKGYGVVYGSAQNLLRSVEVEHFSKDSDESNSLASLLECDLLIMDDLGTEFQTAFTSSAVYNIVNTRMLTGRPTIISTNLTFDLMKKAYSEKVVSRLAGSYSMLRFVGSDIRDILRRERQGT
ncbi:ATP-binding protein [Acetanaerobacterium elongatum]|uniref:DNA replication protein DnaC n=1 Tax=Acetanaerobacterium elongatum TaxID=258515 RepID=A0A1H0AK69_9FIRM|nr:ATP-binding protein [Acetanaerobacterium elongatum]SDN33744.1 DNA replication protein DnaC [Acetanaerobacterium elongatum]